MKEGTRTRKLTEIINISSEELKEQILLFIDKHDSQNLEYLFLLGVNLFSFDTFFKLLFFPVLLAKLVILYLVARPINYAQVIRAEEWTPEHINCGLQFSDDTEYIKKIADYPADNLLMSDFTQLSDFYYFAALMLLLKKYGGEKLYEGAALIDSIATKPETCEFADIIIEIFNIPLPENATLGKKMIQILTSCQSSSRHLLIFSLMMSYSKNIDPESQTITSEIPDEVISLVTPEFGYIQNITRFYPYYLDGYGYNQAPFIEPGALVPTLIEITKRTNASLNQADHLKAILDNMMRQIEDKKWRHLLSPLTAIIALTNPKAGSALFQSYNRALAELSEEVKNKRFTLSPILTELPKPGELRFENVDAASSEGAIIQRSKNIMTLCERADTPYIFAEFRRLQQHKCLQTYEAARKNHNNEGAAAGMSASANF